MRTKCNQFVEDGVEVTVEYENDTYYITGRKGDIEKVKSFTRRGYRPVFGVDAIDCHFGEEVIDELLKELRGE